MSEVPVDLRPIDDQDADRVGMFLHANLNPRLSASAWSASMRVPWAVDAPNAGFMVVDGDRVVGVHLAFYSERTIEGRRERFCNLGAWCVLPEYRIDGLRLLRALLAQDGYHFTDLSPSGNVPALNRRLRFRSLDTKLVVIPNLPWPSWPGRDVISSDPPLIERTLTGGELELYRDHRRAAAVRHLVLIRGEEWCYVMFRKDRRKGLPVFASLLHVSDPRLLRRMAGPLARHLLLRHRSLATLAEAHVAYLRPRLAVELPSPRQKMFRSPDLEPAQIDYLYSELVCVSW